MFAPVLSFVEAEGDFESSDRNCPYALGATVFSTDFEEIERLSEAIDAGTVVVNDMIVPTADPRLPFAARRKSGFGVTRGREGLEAMTQLKVVTRRTGDWLPHLSKPTPHDAEVLTSLIRASHGKSWTIRLQSIWNLVMLGRQQQSYLRHSEES